MGRLAAVCHESKQGLEWRVFFFSFLNWVIIGYLTLTVDQDFTAIGIRMQRGINVNTLEHTELMSFPLWLAANVE